MLLQNLQYELADALMHAELAEDIISPSANLVIYQNNILSNFTAVLTETYPLIRQLVGDDFFTMMTHEYAQHYPSCSSNLHDYGEYFANFFTHFSQLDAHPYLKEVAQFEWICHRLFFAADATPLDTGRLREVIEQDYSKLHFMLHPACEVMQFHFPILKIIDLCQGQHDEVIDIHASGDYLLIIRRDLDIKLVALSEGEFYFLQALAQYQSVETALTLALEKDVSFNLEEHLVQWVNDKTIIDFFITTHFG